MDLDHLFFDKNKPLRQSRKNLPHWDQDSKLQMITFHLADSLPKKVLEEIKKRRKELAQNKFNTEETKIRRYHLNNYVDKMADAGYGECIFRNKEICDIMENSILYFDEVRYNIHAYVIMPNHVHILLEIYEGESVEKIYDSIKRHVTTNINKYLGTKKKRLPKEPYDRLVRNEEHYLAAITYIYKNMESGGTRMINFTRYGKGKIDQ